MGMQNLHWEVSEEYAYMQYIKRQVEAIFLLSSFVKWRFGAEYLCTGAAAACAQLLLSSAAAILLLLLLLPGR